MSNPDISLSIIIKLSHPFSNSCWFSLFTIFSSPSPQHLTYLGMYPPITHPALSYL